MVYQFLWVILCQILIKYIQGSLNKFHDIFRMALLLIVHTWNSCLLRNNLLRLQSTCFTVPTTSGWPHGSPLLGGCQWPSSQPLSSPQLSHNDSLWAVDSRKAGSLWGMMRGVGGVRNSIHHCSLAKGLGLGILCWGLKGVQEEIPSEGISTLQIGSVAFPPGQCTSQQLHPCHRLFDQDGHQDSSSASLQSRPCSLWLLAIPWHGTTSGLQPEEITSKGTRVSCVYYQ